MPFPLSADTENPTRATAIVKEVSAILSAAAKLAATAQRGREQIIEAAQSAAEPLVQEYLDIDEVERLLIRDTDTVIIPSAQPTRTRLDVPTIRNATGPQRDDYVLDGNIDRAMTNISNNIRANYQPLRMQAPGDWTASTIRPADGHAKESRHQRTEPTAPIRLHHLFAGATIQPIIDATMPRQVSEGKHD
jgi:hypothetical protein